VDETTVNILLWCGFRRTGKAMGTSISKLVEDMSRNIFSKIEYRTFYIHL
jgi:hypothetical protein